MRDIHTTVEGHAIIKVLVKLVYTHNKQCATFDAALTKVY